MIHSTTKQRISGIILSSGGKLLRVRVFAAAFAWLCCFCLILQAQSERGTITGSVRDASGAIVPGAKAISHQHRNQRSYDGIDKRCRRIHGAESRSPEVNTVRVEKEGFRPAQTTGLTVSAATTVRSDSTLEVGTSTQAIEVQASAVQLHTEDAKSSVTINNKLVDDLPLVVGGAVRSPFDLAVLTPESKNLGGDNGFMLGGGQAASYGTTLDGVSSNTTRALCKSWVSSNAPSVEAITEFTVDTNGFKAEYGHAGGGVMTFVSKSGTNEFHGSAYEFLRNNDFDSNNFFSNAAGRMP